MPAAPGAPGGLKLSKGGNWKGSETGTRPPNMPKPMGRVRGAAEEGGACCCYLQKPHAIMFMIIRLCSLVLWFIFFSLEWTLTCERCDVVEDEAKVPEAIQPFPAFEPELTPPATLCLGTWLAETEGEEDGAVLAGWLQTTDTTPLLLKLLMLLLLVEDWGFWPPTKLQLPGVCFICPLPNTLKGSLKVLGEYWCCCCWLGIIWWESGSEGDDERGRGGGGRWSGCRRPRGELDDGRGVAAVGGLCEGGLHGRDEVGLVVVVCVRFSLRGVWGMGDGGWRGHHWGGGAEGLQTGVGGRVGAGLGWGGGRRCDAAAQGAAVAADAADATGFGTALSQSLNSSHSSQYPRRANEALLKGGQAEGKLWAEAVASEVMGRGEGAFCYSHQSLSLFCDWVIPR